MSLKEARNRWDQYDAYLFDIDGTLLNCTDATHYFAFCSVLSRVAGRPLNLDGVTAHGNTDIGILRDALKLAGIAEESWRPQLPEICASMCEYMKKNESALCIAPTDGADETLHHLQSKGALLGVATGNLEQIGRLKLSRGRLLDYFDFAEYSDAFEHREDLVREALNGIRSLGSSDASVCVVGDTPADIRAAHANGVEVIAVATGIYSTEQLASETPEICVTSLQQLLRSSKCATDTDLR